MLKKITSYIAVAVASLLLGYYYADKTMEIKTEQVTKIVTKDRIVRKIIRVTTPDGTVKEDITEDASRDKVENQVIRQVVKIPVVRQWSFEASADPVDQRNWKIGVGYRVTTNVSLTASYVRTTHASIPMIGLRVDF